MEVVLAVFGLVAAVAMIWLARGRHRDGDRNHDPQRDHREDVTPSARRDDERER